MYYFLFQSCYGKSFVKRKFSASSTYLVENRYENGQCNFVLALGETWMLLVTLKCSLECDIEVEMLIYLKTIA